MSISRRATALFAASVSTVRSAVPTVPAAVLTVRVAVLAIPVAALTIPVAALADTPAQRFELGVRAGAQSASGVPVSDIVTAGIYAQWRVADRWRIGLGLDRSEFDVERPAVLVGLAPASEGSDADAGASFTTLGIWVERAYDAPRGLEWFWRAGVGGSAVDIETVRGPLQGAGTYAVSASIDGEIGVEEVVVSIGGGVRVLWDRSAVVVALHADRHIADWEFADQVSAATARVDDFSVWGLSVGWSYRF